MLTLWLATGLIGAAGEVEEPAAGLSGRPVRQYRRGRVGRLDEEFRRQLVEEQEARIAAQAEVLARDEPPAPAPDYGRLAALEAEFAALRAGMAAVEFLQRQAAEQRAAERNAAQLSAEIAAYVEALRIAEDRDDEDALEALLFAA